MVKTKNDTMTETVVDNATKVGEGLVEAGKNMMFAGLGLVVSAEQGARDTFSSLVDKGKEFEDKPDALLSRATQEARELTSLVEDRFQQTVTSTLGRAGIPSRDEIRQLSERVEKLTKKVELMAQTK